MLVVIISDIHDNIANLGRCLEWCRQNSVDEIICCGDVTNSNTIDYMSENFSGCVHLVRGNMEIYHEGDLQNRDNILYYGKQGRANIGGKTAGFCHEPYIIEEVKQAGECEIIFYGHTHHPWTSEKDGVVTVNPGTLGAVFQKATFALWDPEEDKLSLQFLDELKI